MKNTILVVSFVASYVFGIYSGYAYFNPKQKQVVNTVNRCEPKPDAQSAKMVELLKECDSTIDMDTKFENERCVCIPWNNPGIDEGPLTKKEICSLKESKTSIYPIIYSYDDQLIEN